MHSNPTETTAVLLVPIPILPAVIYIYVRRVLYTRFQFDIGINKQTKLKITNNTFFYNHAFKNKCILSVYRIIESFFFTSIKLRSFFSYSKNNIKILNYNIFSVTKK